MGKILKIRQVGDPVLSNISKEVDIKNIDNNITQKIQTKILSLKDFLIHFLNKKKFKTSKKENSNKINIKKAVIFVELSNSIKST